MMHPKTTDAAEASSADATGKTCHSTSQSNGIAKQPIQDATTPLTKNHEQSLPKHESVRCSSSLSGRTKVAPRKQAHAREETDSKGPPNSTEAA